MITEVTLERTLDDVKTRASMPGCGSIRSGRVELFVSAVERPHDSGLTFLRVDDADNRVHVLADLSDPRVGITHIYGVVPFLSAFTGTLKVLVYCQPRKAGRGRRIVDTGVRLAPPQYKEG